MKKLKCWVASLAVLLACTLTASAFTTNDANTIFNAYNTNFLAGGYYNGWWTGAEEIEMAEDAYENSPTAARKSIVSNACSQFAFHHGSNWFASGGNYNEYNDDISWAVIAFARGYLITGNTTFRDIAKTNWDGMYNRAWDTNYFGGGLFWRQSDKQSKNSCVEGPATIAACYLYTIFADPMYLTKAKAIYAWERQWLFHTDTGAMDDSINLSGTHGTWASAYNQGTFIGAGNLLFRFTGLPFYYQDALLTAKYTQVKMSSSSGILPQYPSGSDLSGFDGIFCRWLGHFAKDQNLWATFGPWLGTNANAAWNVRTTNYLAWQQWATPLGTNSLDNWGCSAAVIVMQIADPSPLDPFKITPTAGFTAVAQYSILPNSYSINLTLTNTDVTAFNWSLANTSAWLNVSSSSGTLPATSAATVTVSLIPSATTNLSAGRYFATISLTNLSSGVVACRTFTLAIASGSAPIAMTGYNAGVLAPSTATLAAPGATGFDAANNYCFYQAGLNGSTRGLPPDGVFTSLADSSTVFQLQPYGGQNALMMGSPYASSGTVTLATPLPYTTISILASSANGGGLGTLVLNFTNGTHSQALNFNAQDWYNNTANVAIQGMGRLHFVSTFAPDDAGNANNPNMYQTTINLAALGLNQMVTSITFTKPSAATSSGVFAVSGSVMPAQASIVQQPVSLTNNVPAQGATFTVLASGIPPLAYQWFYSSTGNPGTYSPLASQIGSSLVLSPVLQSSDAGSYVVVVTNNYGAVTSSVASLAVYRAPVITQQTGPTNLFVYSGATLGAWSVAVNAALPINYYWCLNGTPIPSAINPTYQLGSVQTNSAGNYSVIVSNAFGSVTSGIIALTVVVPGPYAAALLTNHPVAFWELNETGDPAATTVTAYDYAGGYNGTYNNAAKNGNASYGIAGPRPPMYPGFTATNAALQTQRSVASGVTVPALNLVSTNATIVAWLYPTASQAGKSSAIFINRTSGTVAGFCYLGTLINGSYPLGYVWNNNEAATYQWLGSSVSPPTNQWSLVALAVTATNATIYCWSQSGVQQGVFAHTNTSMSFAGTTQIGNDVSDLTKNFLGNIDNVAVFNYNLSSNTLQNLYSAGIDHPPVFLLNPLTLASANAGQAYWATVSTNASDPDGTPVTFAKVSGPPWLSLASDGSLTGTPLSANVGSNAVVVSVMDAAGMSNTATVNLAVVAAPAIVSSAIVSGSSLQLNWVGGVGPYQVQFTTNLLNPDWQNVGAPMNSGTWQVTPTNDSGYYRVTGQ